VPEYYARLALINKWATKYYDQSEVTAEDLFNFGTEIAGLEGGLQYQLAYGITVSHIKQPAKIDTETIIFEAEREVGREVLSVVKTTLDQSFFDLSWRAQK